MVDFPKIDQIALVKSKIVPNLLQRSLIAFLEAIDQGIKTGYRGPYCDLIDNAPNYCRFQHFTNWLREI